MSLPGLPVRVKAGGGGVGSPGPSLPGRAQLTSRMGQGRHAGPLRAPRGAIHPRAEGRGRGVTAQGACCTAGLDPGPGCGRASALSVPGSTRPAVQRTGAVCLDAQGSQALRVLSVQTEPGLSTWTLRGPGAAAALACNSSWGSPGPAKETVCWVGLGSFVDLAARTGSQELEPESRKSHLEI